MENAEANFDITFDDSPQLPETTHVNVMNYVTAAIEPNAVHLKEEECDVSNDTGENSIDITTQSKPNMFSQSAHKHFSCNICNNSFSQKPNFSSHSRSHTNEKPFMCNDFNKSLGQTPNLSILSHILTNEMPFKCDVCNKLFSKKSSLSNHSHIHSNEKPFKCNGCSKTFSRKHHLDTHSRTHTNE